MLWWILGGILVGVVAVGWLVWPGAGLGIHEQLPVADKRLHFRVRFGSVAARLLKKKASRNHHELYHVLREKQLGIAHVWRYLTDGGFRVAEETAAEKFQHDWRGNADLLDTLATLNQYGAQKR